MKKMVFIILMLIIWACGTKPTEKLTTLQQENIKTELTAIVDSIFYYAEQGDMKEALQPYDNSPEFVFIYNGEVSNYDKISEEIISYYGDQTEAKYNDKSLSFFFIDKDAVIVTFSGSYSVKFDNANKPDFEVKPAAATFLFQKKDGKWKVTYTHESGIEHILPKDTTMMK